MWTHLRKEMSTAESIFGILSESEPKNPWGRVDYLVDIYWAIPNHQTANNALNKTKKAMILTELSTIPESPNTEVWMIERAGLWSGGGEE